MKRIYLLLAVVAASLLSACHPMESIYKELDSIDRPIRKSYDYTLSAADYKTIAAAYVDREKRGYTGDDPEGFMKKVNSEAAFVQKNLVLTSKVSPDLFIPAVVSKMFPEWGKGSSVNVTYNMQQAKSEAVKALGRPAFVELKKDALKEKGISDLTVKLSDEQVAAIAALAKAQQAADSYLVKATAEKGAANLLFIGDKLADPKQYYVLSHADYAAMGMKYDNFSSSMNPDNYLPRLLQQALPYAQEGDGRVVLYFWFVGKDKPTEARYDEYLYGAGQWVKNNRISVTTTQFVHTGEKWIFDPTIRFTLGKEEFDILYRWVKANKPDYISEKYPDNEEWYFCGSGYYANFNLDGGKSVGARPDEEGLSAEQLVALRKSRIQEGLKIILQAKYPDLPAQVNGVDQMYVMTTTIRLNQVNANYSYTYKGLGGGAFDYVSGPDPL